MKAMAIKPNNDFFILKILILRFVLPLFLGIQDFPTLFFLFWVIEKSLNYWPNNIFITLFCYVWYKQVLSNVRICRRLDIGINT
jgi:hypothetical protein